MKNTKLCVTTGSAYADIDALACMVAYAELNNCIAYLPGPLNATVPDNVKNMQLGLITEFPENAEQFVIVDVSNPAMFANILEDKIIKIYDHHTGFEDYWGARGQIEFMGAAATMIYELFGDVAPSAQTANLLSMAIISNTLNLNAAVTTPRDMSALEKLKQFIDMPDDWIQKYYQDTEKARFSDMATAIKNDVKIIQNGWAIAQLEPWDANTVLNHPGFRDTLESQMTGYVEWFLNMPSIGEGKTYLIKNSGNIKKHLTDNFGTEWNGCVGTTSQLFLRKRILKTLGLK